MRPPPQPARRRGRPVSPPDDPGTAHSGEERLTVTAIAVLALLTYYAINAADRQVFSVLLRSVTPPRTATGVVGCADALLNRDIILPAMTMIGGLVDFGFLGMHGTFMQTALHHTAAQAGLVAGVSRAGAHRSSFDGRR